MREIEAENAAEYLLDTGLFAPDQVTHVKALGWGVSNRVLRIEIEGRAPLVLKQSRTQLRTKMLWTSRLERIETEVDVLRLLNTVLPRGTVPEVLFADPANHLFVMSCAPDDSVVWKERLLAGEADHAVARQAGRILGTIHAKTLGHPDLEGRLDDWTVFDELRIDPFYRTIARVHPDLSAALTPLMEDRPAKDQRTLVHADFSPKNILVHAKGLTIVDFETAHAGDPGYDLGFFMSHLILKAFRGAVGLDLIDRFLEGYAVSWSGPLSPSTAGHAAACALARVDGKSPVDYLDETQRAAVRRFARAALLEKSAEPADLLSLAAREMQRT